MCGFIANLLFPVCTSELPHPILSEFHKAPLLYCLGQVGSQWRPEATSCRSHIPRVQNTVGAVKHVSITLWVLNGTMTNVGHKIWWSRDNIKLVVNLNSWSFCFSLPMPQSQACTTCFIYTVLGLMHTSQALNLLSLLHSPAPSLPMSLCINWLGSPFSWILVTGAAEFSWSSAGKNTHGNIAQKTSSWCQPLLGPLVLPIMTFLLHKLKRVSQDVAAGLWDSRSSEGILIIQRILLYSDVLWVRVKFSLEKRASLCTPSLLLDEAGE